MIRSPAIMAAINQRLQSTNLEVQLLALTVCQNNILLTSQAFGLVH